MNTEMKSSSRGRPKNTEANIAYTNQCIDQAKMNKSNQLVGLIVLRSDISFKDIKRHQLTQKGLNDLPRIFLVPNFLDVVTPTTVGFFVNTAPRADKPDTFTDRFTAFMDQHNSQRIKYQFEFGPIWAPSNRVSVFKLMTAFEDKDAARSIMDHYEAGPNEDTYVCMTEYSSLPEAQKIKIIRQQAEYAKDHRSLFIEGLKSIHGKLRPNDEADDSTDYDSVAHWIYDRPTSYDKRMFTRVYGAVNGVVELHTTKESFKEATDWARLAIREIGRQTDEAGMYEIFLNPEEALDAMESLPAWKPHSLSARVELLAEPSATTQPTRRNRRIVSIDYACTNQTKKANTAAAAKKKATKTKNNNAQNTKTTPPHAAGKLPAWHGYGPPNPTTTMTNATNQDDTWDAFDPDTEEIDILEAMDTLEAPPATTGINKYKAAAEANEKRLYRLEEGLLKLSDSQKQTTKNIISMSNAQRITSDKVEDAAQNIDKLVKIVTDNKEDADDKYEAVQSF